jgi:ABC-type polar amino acid transport system ATPase subunit
MPPAGGIFMRGRQAGEILARFADVLEMVASTPKARQFPHELSGGQKQGVAVGRALAHVDGDQGALNAARAGGPRRRC